MTMAVGSLGIITAPGTRAPLLRFTDPVNSTVVGVGVGVADGVGVAEGVGVAVGVGLEANVGVGEATGVREVSGAANSPPVVGSSTTEK